MGQRYAEDIKRIVGIEDTKNGLAPASDREPIAGKRGIGFDGGSRAGIPGTTLAPPSSDGITTDGEQLGFEADIATSTQGSFGADAVLDGDLLVGDELRELQAEDCASGDQLDLRMDGEIPPPDATESASGVELTPNWEDPDIAPISSGFLEGFSWIHTADPLDPKTNFENYVSAIDAGAAFQEQTLLATGLYIAGTHKINDYSFPFPGNPAFVNAETEMDLISGGSNTFNVNANRAVCVVDTDQGCPLEANAATETAFPVDNKATLTIRDGCFAASEFETEVPPEYASCSSVIDFCTAGGRFGRMEIASDGGFLVSERVSKGGALIANGDYQRFGADRKLIGSIDEESAATFRPKEVTTPTPL